VPHILRGFGRVDAGGAEVAPPGAQVRGVGGGGDDAIRPQQQGVGPGLVEQAGERGAVGEVVDADHGGAEPVEEVPGLRVVGAIRLGPR
jgi:hypothetical protein